MESWGFEGLGYARSWDGRFHGGGEFDGRLGKRGGVGVLDKPTPGFGRGVFMGGLKVGLKESGLEGNGEM